MDYCGGRILAITLAPAAPVVTSHPAGASRVAGQLVSLSATASGGPAPTVQWQVSSNGGATFSNIPTATGTLLSFQAAAADNGRRFRAVFTNASGTAISNAAVLTVRPAPPGDIDHDFRTDLIVWRPGSGTWFTLTSSSGYARRGENTDWGSQAAGDVPLMGDLDGDGVPDFIVWNASTGTWSWVTSLAGLARARADRNSGGMPGWATSRSSATSMGTAGRFDRLARHHREFFWLLSSTGYAYASAGSAQWGNRVSAIVPCSATSMATADPIRRCGARPGHVFWIIAALGSTMPGARRQWGNDSLGDRPMLGDFDGDGRSESPSGAPPTALGTG